MTAEIAILNKSAVALAADSAVTIGRGSRSKIYNSANKIFALSKYQPVGIMLYGSAELMDVPWETVIKMYRTQLGPKSFNTVSDYVNDFVKFLTAPNSLFPVEAKDQFLKRTVSEYFHMINGEIDEVVESKVKGGKITTGELSEVIRTIVKRHFTAWHQSKLLPHVTKRQYSEIKKKYDSTFGKILSEIFQKLPLTASVRSHLREIAASLFCRDIFPDSSSGVVFAGFGENEKFPSVISLEVDGIIDGVLKYKRERDVAVAIDLNAFVIPFAQSEMVYTFIEGVDPRYQTSMDSYVYKILEEYPSKIVEHISHLPDVDKKVLVEKLQAVGKGLSTEFGKQLTEFRRREHVNPILETVAVLPKEELAAMAESLVNLTSFKRRISMDAETVGGPIDVAIISKGDGLVWIKRKHYFKPELNPGFFANYYKRLDGEENK